MAPKGSNYFTALAYDRAQLIGFDLTPEVAKLLIEKAQAGDVFWEALPEYNGAIPVHINVMNRRIRFLMDADKARIITMAERDFAAKTAIKQADKFGIVLNLAMTTILMDKIKARDSDVIDVAMIEGNSTEAKLNYDGKGLRVVFSNHSGCITQIDDYAGPRVNPKHPAVTRHAAERAVQRYDTELTQSLTEEIIRRIRTGEQLIDHYRVKSGAMAAITELEEGKPACILYAPAPDNSVVPLRIITVTPMDYHEAHGTKFVAMREAAHAKERASRHERFLERKKNQKKQKARLHRAYKHQDDDDLEYGYG